MRSKPTDVEENFPHLLKLLDDPSPGVKSQVRAALLEMASQIADLLRLYPASEQQLQDLEQLLFDWRKSQLLRHWWDWQAPVDPKSRLEAFFQWLDDFQGRWRGVPRLKELLDPWAESLRGVNARELPRLTLSRILPGDTQEGRDPSDSFLSSVLQRGRGNALSLSCLLILLGARLGFDYQGCPFPGNFLLSLRDELGQCCLLDCCGRGDWMSPQLTEPLRSELPLTLVEELTLRVASVEEIARRVLTQLQHDYTRQERPQEASLFDFFAKHLSAQIALGGARLPLREPLYSPGGLVRHRAKGYRGVVVDYDLGAQDPAAALRLPVYRILVHGSPQVAQADESQLESDQGGLVAHQLLSLFFSRFENGSYVRNSRPWGGGV